MMAESAGDVDFSADNIILSPSNPSEGDSVTVTATLSNSNSSDITGVLVSFHPDNILNTPFHQETVNILGSSVTQVSGSWNSVTFGSHSVVLNVSHNGASQSVSKPFSVSGLVDLVASNIQISPSSDLYQGESVNITVDVSNNGNLDSPASHILIQLDGATLIEKDVLPILAGMSTTIQTSFNAPVAGNHQLTAIANSGDDGITESDVSNNQAPSFSFTVLSSPDYLHYEQPNPEITVTSPSNSLSGPWTLSGNILRMGGSGESTISVGVYRISGENELVIGNFPLTFDDTTPLQSWQQSFDTTQLQTTDPGLHTIRVRIDPSRLVPQSIQFNDDIDTVIEIHPEPNVVVSPYASSPDDTVLSGESVNFSVTVHNTGTLPVVGDLTATFGGESLSPKSAVGIPAGEERTFVFQTSVSGNENQALQFIANWENNLGSYDSDSSDNTAFGSVTLRSNLRLKFLSQTAGYTPQHTPLVVGNTYTYTIDISSEEGSGTESFTCLNYVENEELSSIELSFLEPGSSNTVICSFTAEKTGTYQLYIIPDGASVATWIDSWSISATSATEQSAESTNNFEATILFVLAGVFLVGVLIAAIILTRTVDEDVERETYEYCPSCDGEIEGDEEICPHCEFNLEEGLSQFHDCNSCGTNIPDVIEHCPYCGEVQDISSFYEKRERKEITIEEFEDEEEDFDEIVAGTDDYGDAIQEMGYDEEQLESDWDESLSEAEREIDEAMAEREKLDELTEEEAEQELVISQMRQTHEEHRADIDEIIGDKSSRRHIQDEDVELSASDAHIREDIFKITGEDGVLPGQQIDVEFITDNTVVGNELKDSKEVTDFTVEDDDQPKSNNQSEEEENTIIEDEDLDKEEVQGENKSKRRRPVRRRGNNNDE